MTGRTPRFHCFTGKFFGERTKKTCLGITYAEGSSFILFCKGISEPWIEEIRFDMLTLANQKNIAVTRCDVNITRK